MSKNDITGDKLVSKVQSEKFSEGYDRIWGKKGCQEGRCQHDSDCAVHNEPAYPAGPCDCSLKEKK